MAKSNNKSITVTPELLTAKQVAEFLGVSQRLIWLLTELGDLRSVRIRRCTRWRRADVVNFINRLASSRSGRGGRP